MTESALQAEHEPTVAPEEAQPHPAATRRQAIQALDKAYAQVPVKRGTQQSSAMDTVRDRARVLALTIQERCPPGASRERALESCMSAMLWSLQAISHR